MLKLLVDLNMQNLTPIQKIDYVLKYMANKSQNNFETMRTLTKDLNIEPHEIFVIMNKLVKDGYIDVHEEKNSLTVVARATGEPEVIKRFTISFEGLIFYQTETGYEARRTQSLTESVRQDKFDKIQRESTASMVKLTFWVAVGTIVAAVYYFLEIVNLFCKIDR